jgi:tRNA dimethylallyltransferase
MVSKEAPTTIFIVGPTASGKSSVAVELATLKNGEIVCADSQTLRQDLDIGTAKPTTEERAAVRHHLINLIGPYDDYSVHEFKQAAEAAIKDIISRGKLPIIVGGTGLYIDALYYGYSSTVDASQVSYKKELNQLSIEELQKRIVKNGYEMPKNKQNPRHLIGVLLRKGEVYKDKKPREGAVIYGIRYHDDALKERIHHRIEKMFSVGFLDEVRNILDKYGVPPQGLDAIGYGLATKHIQGVLELNDLIELFERGHWQYARQQKTWFKRNSNIQWCDSAEKTLKKILRDLS